MNPQENIAGMPEQVLNSVNQEQSLISSKELIAYSWNFLKKNWKILAAIMLIPIVLIIVGLSAIAFSAVGGIIGFIVFFAAIIFGIASYPAVISTIHKRAVDPADPITLKTQYRSGLDLFGSFLLVSLIAILVSFGSFTLLVVPAIIVGLYIYFSLYSLVLENKKGFSSFLDSYTLVYGRWKKVFVRLIILGLVYVGIWLVTYGLQYLVGLVFEAPVLTPQPEITSYLIGFVGIYLVLKIVSSIGMTLFGSIYAYRLFISLRDTRQPNVPTKNFKRWLVAFVCIGIVALVVFPVSILLALDSVRKNIEAGINTPVNMAQIEAEIQKQIASSTNSMQQ